MTYPGARLRMGDFYQNFLGNAPYWYKKTILLFLLINPLLWGMQIFAQGYEVGTFLYGFFMSFKVIAGWVLVLQFIFTLAMALRCYPLLPGGLLALEALALRMTETSTVYYEIQGGLKVILLLMFMVAGIYFMRDLLIFIFTKLFLKVRSHTMLSVVFIAVAAILSAFLDALTVMAVIITVSVGFIKVLKDNLTRDYEQFASREEAINFGLATLEFRRVMRGLIMHAAVGTALGGVCTTVGEPQNLLIAEKMGWEFIEFAQRMAIVSMPVFGIGILTCIVLEKTGWFGYGLSHPDAVIQALQRFNDTESGKRVGRDKAKLFSQAIAALFLVCGLVLQLAEVGLIGLGIIVIQTSLNGVSEEKQIGPAFEEALPFTALLVVFFAIVAVIHELHLFEPVVSYILQLDTSVQPGLFFVANGVLSLISDNVFVATVYISSIEEAFVEGLVTQATFDKLAIAINTGTNIPSIGTPNGQAAFLFLLTSSLAPQLELSYMRMVKLALPYTIVLGITGWIMVHFFL